MGYLVSATPLCRSCVLSELQQQIALCVAALDEAADFALAGGGALIVLDVVAREHTTSITSPPTRAKLTSFYLHCRRR